ncbi:hypothetical protein B0H14DRAFT_2626508 [Mycena olivaceomarginata]|nr:hypothetical protein B0H14DRAFT_3571389 [Mycena olivaceomarginata]KAJ7790015.1 hypothetical protein B0H14DRAFT_2626508 [Mycena olivaceomarginata]
MVERPYVKSDFVGLTRRKLYVRLDMIQRRPENFPKGLNLSKINIPDMQKLLLDSQIGFTTNLPGEQQTSIAPKPPNPSKDANVSRGLEDSVPNIQPEDTVPNIQPDVRNVQLRIRDRRFGSSEFNVIQRVNLNFVDHVDCRDNEWRASRIGVPDSEEREYTEYFVTFNVEDKTETFSHNFPNIIIPDGNKLELRVDPNKHPRTLSPIPLSVSESSGPSLSALVARPQAPVDAGVTWLREKIEKRPGYTKFHSNRGKVLQNPDRVESWKFAAQVTSTFHKTSWPAEISSRTVS